MSSKTVLFFNPFADFTGYWDGEPYSLRSGQKMYMQDWLAEHLTKHLVDRELNRLHLPTDFECSDPSDGRFEFSRTKLIAKCLLTEEAASEGQSSVKQELELLNKKVDESPKATNAAATSTLPPPPPKPPFCDSCDSKGVTHKKVCPKNPVKFVVIPSPATSTEIPPAAV